MTKGCGAGREYTHLEGSETLGGGDSIGLAKKFIRVFEKKPTQYNTLFHYRRRGNLYNQKSNQLKLLYVQENTWLMFCSF